jgi:type I restriction enzyme, S subunit
MTWRDLTLGEALRVKHGFAFRGEFFTPEGQHMVVTPGNFLESGGFRVRPGKERFYAGDFPEEYVLSKDDLIIAMTEQGEGLLGSAARIPEDEKFLHNQRIGLISITDATLLDKRFMYWLFNSHSVRGQIRGSATGTKVKHTAPERIYKVKIRAPSVDAQAHIAETLDAYDDLIETNRRRIALLEESARLLYREWFVKLRFPGHELVEKVDGVPAGWKSVKLEEALLLQRGFDLPSSARKPGPVPIYASTGINGYHNVAKATGPGVVTGRSGTLGFVSFIPCDFWPLNTSLWVKEFRQVTPLYAYFLLSELRLEQFNSGASVPTLDRKVAHAITVLIPSAGLLAEFDRLVLPVFEQIETLRLANLTAAQARDALLPKLMSGQLTV